MCRESFVKIHHLIKQAVTSHGGLWVVTKSYLKELILEEFPEVGGKHALDHPTLGISRHGIGSILLHDECPEVIVLFDRCRQYSSSPDDLRQDAWRANLSDSVHIALLDAGVVVRELV